jgi:adenine/guanine phosphoribosyltransferase-like PRPP-binding protein
MSQDVLFVLTQKDIEMNAVKSSNIVNIFTNIVFVEPELYNNRELNIPQPVDVGGMLVNVDKINSFLKKINLDEKLKESIVNKNIYVLSFENFLQTIKKDVSGIESVTVYDSVNVHLFNKGTFTYNIGGLAEFPQIYIEEFKTVAKPITHIQEGTNKLIMLGFDKTFGSLITETKDVPEDNWCKEFNKFDRVEQIGTTLNSIDYKSFLFNSMKENDTLDISKIFTNITHRNMLSLSIVRKIVEFSQKNNINIDYVCGADENGIMFGSFIANLLGLPFVQIKHNSECVSESYDFDSYKVQQNMMEQNKVVLIVDDLITDGVKQKNISSLLNFFFPKVTLFFTLGLTEKNGEEAKEYMGDLFNNIIALF